MYNNNKNMSLKNFQKGSAVYFATIVMILILAMALALTAILLRQMKVAQKMGDSEIVFYAADTGWEIALHTMATSTQFSGKLENGASYEVRIREEGTEECEENNDGIPNFCIFSTGYYHNLQRSIFMRR
jgi:hypothetical protein